MKASSLLQIVMLLWHALWNVTFSLRSRVCLEVTNPWPVTETTYCFALTVIANTVFAPTHQKQEQVKIYLSTWTVRAYKSYPTKEGKAQPKAVPHSEVPIQYGKLCLSVCWLKIIEIYNPVWFPFFEKKKIQS